MATTFLRLARRTHSKLLSILFPPPRLAPNKDQIASQKSNAKQQGLCGEALVLASQLDGKTFRLPDLWKVFSDWPLAANPHAERLEVLVDTLLERIITNERKLKALKQANFGRLISLWYPDAEWPELEIAAAYSVWIFVWDDEVDAGDTDVSNDEELSRAYYKKSLSTIHNLLGLDPSEKGKEQVFEDDQALHPNMTLFADVGRGMRTATDRIQRERFYRELENFMVQVGVEHVHRMRGSIPTVDKYIEIRSGSVGCAPQIAITDTMLKVRLPESIMESPAMKALWKETVVICFVLNDIYSVQKEIAQASLLNLVPVMFKNCDPEKQTLDTVTHDIEITLRDSMKGFEDAAASLTEITSHDSQVSKDTQSFIKWCRYFITGVLQWSLESKRYGMAECLQEDGSLNIVL
ncbi:terpenoid synthase [Annulohypoxylon truncatum]|uniref:terpenoid synthase n=1 Tax=Annulohypoxylon truncatum TaxID=327061 RepID=UPI002008BB24|nr:terpenoid synthase [Annulohypoxylon truncatum]KAI1212333.1 terpenoid synthase [Annulohypoxylon truncatum]